MMNRSQGGGLPIIKLLLSSLSNEKVHTHAVGGKRNETTCTDERGWGKVGNTDLG